MTGDQNLGVRPILNYMPHNFIAVFGSKNVIHIVYNDGFKFTCLLRRT